MQWGDGKAEHHFRRVLWKLHGEKVLLPPIHFAKGTNSPWYLGKSQQHAIMPTDSVKIIYKYWYQGIDVLAGVWMATKPSYCSLLGRYQADFFLYIAARGLSSESLVLQKTFPVPFWPSLTWLNCTSHQQPGWIHMCPEAKGHREGFVAEESWGQRPCMEGGWQSSLYSAFFLLFWIECTTTQFVQNWLIL